MSLDDADLVALTNPAMALVLRRLDRLDAKIDTLIQKEETMAADLTHLTDEVTQNGDAVASAVTLLGNLSQLIRDNAADQAALNDIANQLDAQSTSLAEAVVANTPAAPAPPVEPGV